MLSINPWSIFWTVINILVLFLILKKFLFKPVLNVIASREECIRQSFAEAQKKQLQADDMKQEYQIKLSTAQKEAEEIIQEARAQAEEEHGQMIEKTRTDSENMLRKAKADIENEEERAKRAVEVQIAQLALAAARKIMEAGDAGDASSNQ